MQIFAQIHLLFYATLACIVGIWWQSFSSPSWYPLLLLAVITTGIIYYFTRSKKISIAFALIPLFLLIGAWRLKALENNQVAHEKLFSKAKTWDAVARVVQMTTIDHPRYQHCITLALTSAKPTYAYSWTTTATTLQCYATSSSEPLQIDDIVIIRSLPLQQSHNNDYKRYLMKNGVALSAFTKKLNATLLKRPAYSFFRWINAQRNNLYEKLKNKIPATSFALFATLFLGNTTEGKQQKQQTRTNFTSWGIAHFLARSGLHLIILILLWSFLLCSLPISFNHRQLLLIILIALYSLLSWTSISFLRALITFFIYKICTIARLQTQLLHILTLTTLIVILYNPMQIFFLDFQLSFGLTAALAVFNFLKKASPSISHQNIASQH